jgi:hypothetical protein
MTYICEASKFLLLSFYKRCKIVIQLLVKIRGSAKQNYGQDEVGSVEFVLSDMLIGNFKWYYLTLQTQFDYAEALNLRRSTIFFNLSQFHQITLDTITLINQQTSKAKTVSNKYYE